MFKKFIGPLLTTLCFFLYSSGFAHNALPDEFTVTERWISLTTTFDIKSKTEVLGTVHRKIFSLVHQYQLLDMQENLLASARMRFFSLLTIFDVTDYNSNSLGIVKEELTWFFPTFTIISPNQRILGEAVLNFWNTKFTISDPFDGHTIATIERPFLRLKSNWVIKIEDMAAISVNNIHPHLLMTLAAFQVDREYWTAYRQQLKEEDFDRNDSLHRINFSVAQNKKSSTSQMIAKKSSLALENIRRSFQDELESYRFKLNEIEPTERDFASIESMEIASLSEDKLASDVEKLQNSLSELFALFSSDQVTESEKAALFIMLENKLY